jgi:prepilin-type N-terminal cleavage/methylation domain-containing protein
MFTQPLANKPAFTLVELLVVIAIVGLLSTIVLVSTSGLSSQASVTKTLAWARSINSALGAEAVGVWNFDEGIENTCPDGKDTCDISGWNNHGTMYNFVSPQGYVDTTPSGHGSALSFDGVDDYVDCGTNNSLQITTAAGTLEAWIKTNYNGEQTILTYPSANPRFGTYESRLRIYWGEAYYSSVYNTLYDNKFHHVVATFNEGKIKYYFDASFKQDIDIPAKTSGTNVKIGALYGSSGYFVGVIDEVRIYNTALTSSQIKSQYYTGLDRLLTKGLIDEQEYRERLTLK